jgi:hypothetical protein
MKNGDLIQTKFATVEVKEEVQDKMNLVPIKAPVLLVTPTLMEAEVQTSDVAGTDDGNAQATDAEEPVLVQIPVLS